MTFHTSDQYAMHGAAEEALSDPAAEREIRARADANQFKACVVVLGISFACLVGFILLCVRIFGGG